MDKYLYCIFLYIILNYPLFSEHMFAIIISGDVNMDIKEKLEILSDAAKYDVSCSSSGSNRKGIKGALGDASHSGICHSFTPDGRCISLLKILFTNYCIYDCSYCINRKSNDVKRAAFTVDEVVDLTINFYRRNYIEGLFLSSAIIKNPNHTMEMLTEVVERLRTKENFHGYIHLKAIPGADDMLIKKAGSLVDRMSVNIELPSSNSLKLLAPDKKVENILTPMSSISHSITENRHDRKIFRSTPLFVPGGQSTQLIVGATKESDQKILTLSENLYSKYDLKRVYYSAYIPLNHGGGLPDITAPPTLREHRLYQADWLLRLYGFKSSEILNENTPNLDVNLDPKSFWAINNLHLFPMEINKAPYNMLIRVPGIGFKSAKKIISARRMTKLTFEDLKKMNISLKRAIYFITCNGKYFGDVHYNEDALYRALSPVESLEEFKDKPFEQISFFSQQTLSSICHSKITGEM